MTSHRSIVASLTTIFALLLVPPSKAETWPKSTVKIIAPFAAGGSADNTARITAQELTKSFGQPFVVENRAGASGTLAAEAVMRAAPDGHTLFWATANQIAITPAISKPSYDPVKDFEPISILSRNAFVLLVHSDFGAATLADFIERIRQEPKIMPYGASGIGSATHVLMALLLKRAAIEMIPVMYRGAAPAMNDLLSGQIKAMFAPVPLAQQQMSGSLVRLLGVSSKQRVHGLVNVPTFVESGFPGFVAYSWNGLMAPAGTPREVIDRLAKEIARIVRDEKIRGLFVRSGLEPIGDTPAEFAQVIATDIKLWTDAVSVVPKAAAPATGR